MGISRRLLMMLAVGAATSVLPFTNQYAAQPKKETPLSELSGILHKGEKTIMPYLVLDGSNERCYLRGKPLAVHATGARIYVRGVLRSKLFDSTGTDWTRLGAPAPPPFRKGWVVYMDLKEAETITEPFGTASKTEERDSSIGG